MGPAIRLMRFPANQLGFLHPAEERGDGVRVARHVLGQGALGEPRRFGLKQGPHDGELVRRDAEVRNPTAERLVQAEPSATEQGGKAATIRRIDGGAFRRARLAANLGWHACVRGLEPGSDDVSRTELGRTRHPARCNACSPPEQHELYV